MAGFFTKLFGDKASRDLKALLPVVEAVNKEWLRIKELSNDGLREESAAMRREIQAYIRTETEAIAEIRHQINADDEREEGDNTPRMTIEERESRYKEIDVLEKAIDDKVEEILQRLLPRAFAVMKDTARRFSEHKVIRVKATPFDRNLCVDHDFVEIEDDTAIYFNSWIAGGNETKWDMVHYDVQLIGGSVLHQGKIAEMATGEGKTLVATLPVFLNALSGRGVHVVTVNDYLAKRDSEWMGPLYMFHGLSVDCIDKSEPHSAARRAAYMADITFGTNNEFGFDYLRDNMATHPEELVQRKHNYAIVDEVDSVLIDDARTPLIISGPVDKGEDQLFDEYKPRVERLVRLQRELVMKCFNEARQLLDTAEGDKVKLEQGGILLLRAHKGLPKYKPLIKFLSEQGNRAILLKTENEYMQENNRRMPEITDSLYFIIDEKNRVIEITDKGHDTLTASGEDPEFFILPDVGAEIADIEKKSISDDEKIALKDQMIQNFAIKSDRVHTVNQLLKAYTLFEKDIEYVVIDNKVKIVDEQTGRIMEGRRYSEGLHQAIESKENVKVEAATQTFATITLQNYFRMYHKLAGMTGTAETEAGEFWDIYKLDVVVIPTNRPVIREDHDDFIYKTKREKYNAVIEEINRLVKEGRPVLVGTTSVEVSELLSRMLKMRGIRHNVLNAKLHQREAEIVADAGRAGIVTIATNMAGRGTDIKLTPEVRAAGGLAIIGTERHDSRRVDRQLRGRAGRQGDPGSSQFFVSLEDDLMRLFSSERIVSVMDRLGHQEGDVIQHSMITKSIERAQKRVEENHYGVRKRLLEYDDVMNSQRNVIYERRRHSLLGERIAVDVSNSFDDVCRSLVAEYHEEGNFDSFRLDVLKHLSLNFRYDADRFKKESEERVVEELHTQARQAFDRKGEAVAKQVYPIIKNVYLTRGEIYKNIVVPFTDGAKQFNIVTNLERAYKTRGAEVMTAFEKSIILSQIDEAWKENLREMDDLKNSVQNASYEQKDPLLIYKLESYNLFEAMIDHINKSVVSILMKGQVPLPDADNVKQADDYHRSDHSRMRAGRNEVNNARPVGGNGPSRPAPVRVAPKVGRNDLCPCGSGKKFKNCHGAADASNQ